MSYHYLKGIENRAELKTQMYFGVFWWFVYLFKRNKFIEIQNKYFMEIWRKDKVKIKPMISVLVRGGEPNA